MAEFQIDAQVRSVVGKKVKQLRKDGVIPGTVYGPHTEPLTLQFNSRELETTLRNAGGTNLIDVNVAGDQAYPVLAREVQRDVIKGNILHVDFFAVDMNKKIRAEVPVVFEGQSPMVASRKGIMLTGPNSLTLEMFPKRILNQIVIDVSVMDELGATFAVKDLDLGDDMTVINDPEEMLARIVQPSAARAAENLAIEAEGTEDEEGGSEEASDE